MKKILVSVFATLMLFSCASWKRASAETPSEPTTPPTTEVAPQEENKPTPTPQVEEVKPITPQEEVVEEKFDLGKWFEENFKIETIITLINTPIVIAALTFLFKSLKKAKYEKETTAKDVEDVLKDYIGKTNKDAVKEMIAEVIKPLEVKIDKNNEVFNGFAKVLTLQQEKTPESRIACLKVLQELGNVEEKVVENAKKEVEKQIEETIQVETEKKETLENIVKVNSEGRC